jgi:hypothetical protein
MNQNEKPDTSPEVLAKINKTVLKDVPGAEIISQAEAIQKDQEKYKHDLDEKGSVFPSIPVEQITRKTKQERDRIELRQDMLKLDKQNKKTSKKILKHTPRLKNQSTRTLANSKFSLNLQVDDDLKKRNKTPQKLNIYASASKIKNYSSDNVTARSKTRQDREYSNKGMLKNHRNESISKATKSQNFKHDENLFDIKSYFVGHRRGKEKMQMETSMTKQESLFEMNIDSFGIPDLNGIHDVTERDDFQMHDLNAEKKEHERVSKSRPRPNDQEILTNSISSQDKMMTMSDRMKKYENTYSAIKHANFFEIDNELKFE